ETCDLRKIFLERKAAEGGGKEKEDEKEGEKEGEKEEEKEKEGEKEEGDEDEEDEEEQTKARIASTKGKRFNLHDIAGDDLLKDLDELEDPEFTPFPF